MRTEEYCHSNMISWEDLLSDCNSLEKERDELKKQLDVACHVKYGDADAFDWGILHRIWDLEDSLERVIDVAYAHRNNPYDGIYAIIALAKRALKRSRGEDE